MNLFILFLLQVIDPSAVLNDMRHYGEPGYESLTAKWDEMQRELRYTNNLHVKGQSHEIFVSW
jgi:hypothetical protein